MKKLTSFLALQWLQSCLSQSFRATKTRDCSRTRWNLGRCCLRQLRQRFDVDFRFRQDGFSRHGKGYEYDYGAYHPYIYFEWSVENGNIFLDYEDNTHVVISDYRLGRGYLDGRLQQTRNGWRVGDIHLTKVSNNPYDSGYDYWAKAQRKIVDDSETDSIK